ncbi:Nuclear transition protein like [Actinidia chinensis var. chinensis]|uniref:Nuclear transition protein like n=1 Tax=Actinidia chinensis var. chinensis TaxID=1590841 RepID=A0A2R6PPH7_ACTCC|nr:Nuclear transition protein like [Actinidia chinensis var. chinensis]
MLPQFLLLSAVSFLTSAATAAESFTIYEVLRSHGLPTGLIPTGVNDFKYDQSGQFEFHLDRECNVKFDSELHYDRNVSGNLFYGQIAELSGISAQDLFLWFPVKEIRVDVPSSGLIYFDVGVVSKQFSLSLFETPRDCVAAETPDHVSKSVDMASFHIDWIMAIFRGLFRRSGR